MTMANFTAPGGCRDQVRSCCELGDTYDPEEVGLNATVSPFCSKVLLSCQSLMERSYENNLGCSVFNIVQKIPSLYPQPYT